VIDAAAGTPGLDAPVQTVGTPAMTVASAGESADARPDDLPSGEASLPLAPSAPEASGATVPNQTTDLVTPEAGAPAVTANEATSEGHTPAQPVHAPTVSAPASGSAEPTAPQAVAEPERAVPLATVAAATVTTTAPVVGEDTKRAAPAQVVGPGGGKRRKRGQEAIPTAPEWVAPPPPQPQSALGGPAIWGVMAIVAVLMAGTVLSNGAFTPFAVDTVAVATNTLSSDTVAVAPGRVQSTSITLGDLTPGTTVVRASFSVRAEAPGTGKPVAAYVSLVADTPAPYVRATVFRCLDAGGSPTRCDGAVGFSTAHLNTTGSQPTMIETTGGPPASATVRSVIGGDLEILDGAANVKTGGKVRGFMPVTRPSQGGSATMTDFFVVGGTTGGLGHGAQDVGVNGATATLPMVKGIPGLPPGGESHLLTYWYALPDAPVAEATAKVGVTVAVFAIGADATP
jgi:hypothetical protein